MNQQISWIELEKEETRAKESVINGVTHAPLPANEKGSRQAQNRLTWFSMRAVRGR